MAKKRAMTSEKASFVKRKGHQDAKEFAELLGIGKEFKSDPTAKKDVIDIEGYSYSVKSGEKKWQIFLYGETRFKTDYTFRGINGLGNLFLKCIYCFPKEREDYLKDKLKYKKKLQPIMRKLCRKLKIKRILEAFLDKSLFNSGEVDFLVIKQNGIFYVFWGRTVVKILSDNIEAENSKAKNLNQLDDQKVIFKLGGKTIGEIELRNDSNIHYREVKFWLDKNITFNLLKTCSQINRFLGDKIILYDEAVKKLKYLFK